MDNTQSVEDFNWDTSLEEEPPSQETVVSEAEPEPAPQPPTPPPPPREKEENLGNLELLLDIPLEITAELGRSRMIINDLLQLGQGSVIELNKLAGEPLEILVNQKLIARGEVVVVNEKFGIRLTDIISPLERIKQLT